MNSDPAKDIAASILSDVVPNQGSRFLVSGLLFN